MSGAPTIRAARSIQSDMPPLEDGGADSGQLWRRAQWDFVAGLRLWEMWSRLSWNEVRRRYRRTMLGPMWVTVSLLVFATVMSFVWATLWKQNVVEFLPFLLSGLIPWTMISAAIGESCATFLAGEGLMKSRQFPYSILVYGVLARNVVIFGHNLVAYLIVAVLCGVQLGFVTLLLVPSLLIVLVNCGWICMLVAILCLRFRDFQQLVASVLQVSMFVTPVFWSASQLQGRRAIIVDANVLYHMIELMRRPLLGELPTLLSFAVCIATAIVGWAFALWLFARKRHRLAYWF